MIAQTTRVNQARADVFGFQPWIALEQDFGRVSRRQHAQNVSNALTDLRDWIQKMRNFDTQILKASNLSTPTIMSTALQLKQLAEDAYTGRTIPPNPGPLPILGSAGAYQAFVECQYMATLDIKKIA